MAGRGIDIKDVSMVINYDMAKTIEGKLFEPSSLINIGIAETFDFSTKNEWKFNQFLKIACKDFLNEDEIFLNWQLWIVYLFGFLFIHCYRLHA